MAERKSRRPQGAPTKDPSERKSSSVTFRIPDQLKQELDASARYHGRTLSEEIGYRLKRSFVEGRAVQNMTSTVKMLLRDQGASDAQIEEMIAGYTYESPDAAAEPPAMSRPVLPREASSAAPAPPLDEEAIYNAIRRALRDDREEQGR